MLYTYTYTYIERETQLTACSEQSSDYSALLCNL